jgi:uncharacterized protein YukE
LPEFKGVSMTATIAVEPARLRQAATAARTVGGRLLEVRGQLGATTADLPAALGGPDASSAFAEFLTLWSHSVLGLASVVVALAAALEAAAAAYERADRDSVPRVDGPAGGGGTDAPAR